MTHEPGTGFTGPLPAVGAVMATGTTVVLGAGAVGTATAWYLLKAGHRVEVVERQPAAGLETSWGNGGVIHASEVEPWSQPGMPRKILGWLGKENAPLLLRYGAIPQMWRWGLAFAANCTPERFRANTLANLALALHSLRSLQEIGAETGIAYDRAANGVLKIYRSRDSLDAATRGCEFLAGHGLLFERLDGPRLRRARAGAGGRRHLPGRRALLRARRGRRLQQVHARSRRRLRRGRRHLPLRDGGAAARDHRRPGHGRRHRQGSHRRRPGRGRDGQLHRRHCCAPSASTCRSIR